MLNLTDEQIDKKIDELPQNLQDVLFDYEILSKVDSICLKQGFLEEKKEILFSVFGQVIMGFIKSSDLEKELKETLFINDSDAKNIAEELNEKIFNSFESDLDKLATSTPSETQKLKDTRVSPPVLNLKNIITSSENNQTNQPPSTPVVVASFKPPVFSPIPIKQENQINASSPATPKSLDKISKPAPVLANIPFSSAKPDISSTPFSTNLPITPVFPLTPKSAAPFFREQNFLRPVPGDSPFMIHEESSFKPITGSSDMERVAVPQMEKNISQKETPPPVRARIEIGIGKSRWQESRSEKNVTAKTELEKKKIVNYSAFVAPTDPFKKVNTATESFNQSPLPSSIDPTLGKVFTPSASPMPSSPISDFSKSPVSSLVPSSPVPSAPSAVFSDPTGPKINGNIVDLRK